MRSMEASSPSDSSPRAATTDSADICEGEISDGLLAQATRKPQYGQA